MSALLMDPVSTRAAFLAERRIGIGGSDVASLFGIGYGCTRRLWYDKTNTPRDFPDEDTDAMELGRFLEPLIRRKFAAKTGRNVRPHEAQLVHPTVPEALVHIDGIQAAPDRQTEGAVEIKAVGRAVFYQIKREGMPEDYVLQLQHGMGVMGLEWGSFAVMNRDSGQLLHWDEKADPEIIAAILEEIPQFMARVRTGPAPDRLDIDDRRCQSCAWRTTCQGAALQESCDGSEDYDESLSGLVAEYAERAAGKKEAGELVEETKQELMTRMGARAKAKCAAGSVVYGVYSKRAYTVAAHDERPLRVFPRKKKG